MLEQRLEERVQEELHTALLFLAAIEGKERIAELGDRLDRALAVPVLYEDERLTSAAAQDQRRQAGAPRGQAIDDLAASLLLEQFLAGRRSDRATVDQETDIDAPA